MRRCQLILGVSTGVAAACSSQADRAPDPATTPAVADIGVSDEPHDEVASSGLSLEWQGHDAAALGRPLRFCLHNTDSTPWFVLGFYSLEDPATRINVARNGDWNDVTPMRDCGVGIRWLPVPPGESAIFNTWVHVETNPEMGPMRVGVIYRARGGDMDRPDAWLTAWTAAFVPDELINDEAALESLKK